MKKIDKFELMLMDSPINILGLPDGAVEQIIELMAKCYTTRNDEVVKMLQEELTETENKITGENNTFYEVGSMQSIISDNVKTVMAYHATRIEKLLTKLKQPNNK